MKGESGENVVFTPMEVTVSQQLETVRVVQRAVGQAVRQFPNVEGGFDLLDPGGIVPKNPVHPPVNPEGIAAPLKHATDRHFRLIQGITLCPLLLHPDVYLLSVSRRAAVA